MNFSLVYPGERTRFAITATLAILFWALIILGTAGIALLYVLLFFVAYLFAQSAFISYLRGSAVKLSPEQFPDLYAHLEACCAKLNMPVPEAYLLHADGLFNALATRFLGRHYVVLFTSVVDALHDKPEAMRFYIGHELGHIHRKHLTWGPVLAPMAWLPLLGAATRRAEEYTCDRYGLFCCENGADARHGMAALAAGHSRWKTLNYDAYREQRADVTGFWASFHEFTNDYPWTAKRAHAIDELAQGREPKQHRRSFFAGLLSLLVPRVPGAGGAGFLMVIALIGILAAIAIPAYQDYSKRAAVTTTVDSARVAQQAVEAYAVKNREWPSSLEQLEGVNAHIDIGKTGVDLELGENGRLVYRFGQNGFKGETLELVPEPILEQEQLTGLRWHCSSEELAAKLLPQSCR